jgi:putative lipoic acid-binding regulatory protein
MITRQQKADLERQIIEVLKKSDRALTPGDIRWRLEERGRYHVTDIKNACERLERRGSILMEMWERGWFRVKHFYIPAK